MKTFIFICIAVFGTIGGYLGSLLDGGNMFGVWSILFSTVGSFVGIWAGYKAGRSWLE